MYTCESGSHLGQHHYPASVVGIRLTLVQHGIRSNPNPVLPLYKTDKISFYPSTARTQRPQILTSLMEFSQIRCERALGHVGKDEKTERFCRIGRKREVGGEREEEVFEQGWDTGEDTELSPLQNLSAFVRDRENHTGSML